MEKKHFIIIIVSIIVLSITVFCIIFFTRGTPVESEAKAKEIARNHVLKKYSDSFDDYEISVNDDGELWIVSYDIPPVYDENGEIVEATLGGGGPEVKIKKSNGKITYCMLQC